MTESIKYHYISLYHNLFIYLYLSHLYLLFNCILQTTINIRY